jgi:hypothetical protein
MVYYYRSPTAVSTLVAFMTQLHGSLVSSGWEVEFIDSDAIGSGTAEDPAWDTTPVVNTDGGVVVYKMPPIDPMDVEEQAWYVRLRTAWGSNVARPQIRSVTVGTSVDGSGDVSGGPDEFLPAVATATSNNVFFTSATYEHGFFFDLHIAGASHLHIERLRDYAGEEILNELVIFYYNGTTYWSYKINQDGMMPYDYFFMLANNDGVAVTTQVVSTASRDGSTSFVPGPFFPGGDPFHWHPRLACLMPNNEVTSNQDILINIDGGVKTYRAITINLSTTLGRWVVATE